MVPSIARQSVIIKCNAQKSVLLGNYEFYYAAGLAKRLFGLKADGEAEPKELLESLLPQLAQCAPEDERQRYLIGLITRYDPAPEADGQMRDLFRWGEYEQDLWQIQADGPA